MLLVRTSIRPSKKLAVLSILRNTGIDGDARTDSSRPFIYGSYQEGMIADGSSMQVCEAMMADELEECSVRCALRSESDVR